MDVKLKLRVWAVVYKDEQHYVVDSIWTTKERAEEEAGDQNLGDGIMRSRWEVEEWAVEGWTEGWRVLSVRK